MGNQRYPIAKVKRCCSVQDDENGSVRMSGKLVTQHLQLEPRHFTKEKRKPNWSNVVDVIVKVLLVRL